MSSCARSKSKRVEGETVAEVVTAFVDAVEARNNLEIIDSYVPTDTAIVDEVFVLEDHDKVEGIEGKYIEVNVSEIVRGVYSDGSLTALERAEQLVSAILCERPEIVLHGITRIVGYYSRVTNWNKSKRGELRDRALSRERDSGYVLGEDKPVFTKEAVSYIDNLSGLSA